jgi:glutaredoxin-like YruB-family protein
MTQEVTVYSTPTCTWCNAVKQYLQEKGVAFSEVDVSADMQKARELVERTGQYGVPVIDVDGEFVVGFDRPRLEALLASGN